MCSIRRQAMNILFRSLSHASLEVRRAAVQAASKIGESHPAYRGEVMSLEDLVAQERRQAFQIIADRLQEEQEISVLHTMEDVLLKSWLMQVPGSDVVEEALADFSCPTELKVLRWTLKPRDAFDTFTELKQEAPDEDRWSWWVRRKHDSRADATVEQMTDNLRPLVEEIKRAFPGVQGFITLLVRLVEGGYEGSGMVPPWLWGIASGSPELVDTCLRDPAVVKQVPVQFIGALRSVWSATDQEAYGKARAQLPDDLKESRPEDVYWLLRTLMVAPDRPDAETAAGVLEELAGHPDPGVRDSIVDFYINWLKVPSTRRIVIYAEALSAGYNRDVAEHVWDDIEHHIMRGSEDVERAPLRDAVVQAFIQEREQDDTVLPNLLLWCLREDTRAWLDVLERCLQVGGELWGLRLAPEHMGMRQEPIHSVADLTLAISRLESWEQEELIKGWQRAEFQKWLGSRDFAATNEYIETVIENCQESEYLTCARMLSDRGFGKHDQELWLHLLRSSHGTLTWVEVSKKFMGTASFVGSWSSAMGQDPPAFAGRLDELRRLHEQTRQDEPHIARLVKEAILIMEDRIDHHRKDEQEMLDPR